MLVMEPYSDTGTLAERLVKPSFAAGSSLHRIQSEGRVRVGVIADTPGFSCKNPVTGRFEGLDITLARRLAQSVFGGTVFQVRELIEFVEVDMGDRVAAVVEGRVDFVVSVLAVTEERRKVIDFTRPYYGAPLSVMVPVDGAVVDLGDLRQARLAVLANGVEHGFVQQHEVSKRVVETANNGQTLQAVLDDRVDAAIASSVVLDEFVANNPGKLRRLSTAMDNFPFAVGIRKGDETMRTFFDLQIEDLVQHGFVAIADACRRRGR